ncbi:hypothetical protein WMY93_007482 [Mugilogobius chulae]|uniref:Uncharacterized protein n=1 Tax=Mugilogobius chulae TaxID=88201 RepID=A0AAW0PG73_9GOBI
MNPLPRGRARSRESIYIGVNKWRRVYRSVSGAERTFAPFRRDRAEREAAPCYQSGSGGTTVLTQYSCQGRWKPRPTAAAVVELSPTTSASWERLRRGMRRVCRGVSLEARTGMKIEVRSRYQCVSACLGRWKPRPHSSGSCGTVLNHVRFMGEGGE